MNEPLVDVMIAVHSKSRPIARAVASILGHTATPVRVTVIAHNIDVEVISHNLGAWAVDPRVRLISHHDGVFSPAGPLNLGLAEATAPFMSIMGSDDEFQPGAIDSWLALQRKSGAAFVIARIFHEGRGNDSYPPVRWLRQRNLDPVKDRLSYRSAPLGLISREKFGHLRFTEGMSSGEDLGYVSHIWFSGETIAFDRVGPAYLGHHDAEDRVSFAPRPVEADFVFLNEIFDAPWFAKLNIAQRRAIAVKLIRMHVFDAILARNLAGTWTSVERAALVSVVRRILRTAPGVEQLLSRIDRRVLEVALTEERPASDLSGMLKERWNYKSANALLPQNVFFALHSQSPFRTLFAGLAVMRPVRK